MKKYIYTAVLGLLVSGGLFAQRTLTLEECIDIALENNINIKTARNNAISAKAGYAQSKFNFLPSLNASAGHSWSEGLQFDQTVGDLVNTTTLGGNGSISAGVTIFDGFSNRLRMGQRNLQYQAALETIKSSIQATEAAVIGGFLDIISTKEQLKISNQTLELLNDQLARQVSIERAGTGSMEQVYNFRSLIAQQKLTIVTQSNGLATSKLALIQLLLLNSNEEYEFAGITINDAELELEIEEFNSVYDKAIDFSPGLKSANFALEAAEKSLKIAKNGWMPTLTAGASWGTGWSSNFVNVLERDAMGAPTRTEVTDWGTQFERNERKGANLSLGIPIFNRFATKTGIQQSKMQMLNSQLAVEQTKNTLTNQVQQAYLGLLNAKTTYSAAKESLVNLDTSFEFTKTRYESGTIDFVTYLQSLNNKIGGELQLVQAKYGIMLRKLILDIFTGESRPAGSN
ncbi:TolC family protein [Roseivirga sp.]|uniref:TolC family protein n=1 Tax=Roseivirga sp. TaxID=1964215 RepID=UPI003B8BAC73